MGTKKVADFTVEGIFKTAEKCFKEEVIKDATNKVKCKLSQLRNAKKIVANLEREIEELKLEIADELESS